MGESTCSLLHHHHQEADDPSEIIPALIHRISFEQEEALTDQELANPRTSRHMNSHRRSTSQPQEIFEFFSDLSSEMSPAEDMILCGRLVPFKDTIPPPPLAPVMEASKTRMGEVNKEKLSSTPCRSGSLIRSQSATKRRISSRSLDYRKLNRGLSNFSSCSSSSSSNSSQERVHDGASTARSSSTRSSFGESSFKSKPGWFVLMFGLVKSPNYGPMELKDIKIRQSRRKPPTMFLPAEDGGGSGSRSAVAGNGYSCRLLRVLSCKNHASVAVETSLYDVPHGV